jgi:tyrosine aminotransferase
VIKPANPMVTVFTRQHIQDILAFSDKHEVPLVVDEVYYKMVYPDVDAPSFGEVTEDVPVIVLSG